MASRIYPSAYTMLVDQTLDWENDTIRALLVSDVATYDRTHDRVNDVTANELSDATRVTLTTIAPADNGSDRFTFDASDATFASQTGSQTVGAAIVYKFITDDASSPLIAFIDGTDLATNGTDVLVTWGTNGVFDITY